MQRTHKVLLLGGGALALLALLLTGRFQGVAQSTGGQQEASPPAVRSITFAQWLEGVKAVRIVTSDGEIELGLKGKLNCTEMSCVGYGGALVNPANERLVDWYLFTRKVQGKFQEGERNLFNLKAERALLRRDKDELVIDLRPEEQSKKAKP